MTAARKQAEQIVSNANADAERQTVTARSELETLTKRRDGIVSQLGALRDLVASFGGDSAAGTEEKPADKATPACAKNQEHRVE